MVSLSVLPDAPYATLLASILFQDSGEGILGQFMVSQPGKLRRKYNLLGAAAFY